MTATLTDWIGKQERREDFLHPQPARFMQATLDRTPTLDIGDPLPPLWHWLYFLEARPLSELGRDAHPKKGGFLPPVPLPRRMWAGGRLRFHAPIPLGSRVAKTSTIHSVVQKTGRTGPLCFVTVEHLLHIGNRLMLSEEHDIVYRADPDPKAPAPRPAPAPEDAEFSAAVTPSEVMLFRYSSLTFNGHRIHYDAEYARAIEGYEGLVFHGPLTATLLAGLAAEQRGRAPVGFDFTARAPLANLHPFSIHGRSEGNDIALWARRHDGALAMQAVARF